MSKVRDYGPETRKTPRVTVESLEARVWQLMPEAPSLEQKLAYGELMAILTRMVDDLDRAERRIKGFLSMRAKLERRAEEAQENLSGGRPGEIG